MAPKIRKRGNSWHAVVWLGRDADGKPIRQSITRPTKREVQEEIDRIRAEYAQGTYVQPNKMSVKEFFELWLEKYPIKSPTTRESYESIIRQHIIPELGHYRLQKLTPLQLQEYYAKLLTGGRKDGRAGGLSAGTVINHHRLLHRAFTIAVRWRLLAQNPAAFVEPPTRTKYRHQIWTPEEATRFLEVIAQHRLFALYVTAMLTGMRRGELFGLKWSDIDFQAREITVQREMLMVGGRGRDGHKRRPVLSDELKTLSSHRTISISPLVCQALTVHRAEQEEEKRILGDRYHDENLVFCRPDGRRYHLESISGRQFQQLQEKAKVPRIRFHDLRHTHATWMLMNGEHPKVVSERLGHTTPTLFMTTYSHVIPEMDRAAADRLDALLPNLHQMLRATKRDKTPPNASRENEEAHRQIS